MSSETIVEGVCEYLRKKSDWIEGDHFKGPSDGYFFLRAGRFSSSSTQRTKRVFEPAPYWFLSWFGVGDRVFVDHRLREDLVCQPIYPEAKEKITFLHNFDTIFQLGKIYAYYSAIAIYALEQIEVRDQHILELGSADGLLSLVAKTNGAAKVTAVDLCRKRVSLLEKNLTLNGLSTEGLLKIAADINSPELVEEIPKDVNVVCANLGDNQYEGKPNKAAIRMLENFPEVKYFLGGGYAENTPHNPYFDLKLLEELGFKPTKWIKEIGRRPMITFIAERA